MDTVTFWDLEVYQGVIRGPCEPLLANILHRAHASWQEERAVVRKELQCRPALKKWCSD